jgi:peptidoglycan/LPS O-acetylase OafA/YrhL
VLLAASILTFWKHYSFLCSSVGFTLLNLSFALLTASALSHTSLLARIHMRGAKQIAVLSYSIYLTHTLALELTGRVFGGFQSLPAALAAVALILLFAGVLHFGVERPSFAFRDHLLEKSKTRRYAELVNASPISSH